MSIETARSLGGAREDRGVELAAVLEPRAGDAVAGRDGWAGAERDHDRRLLNSAPPAGLKRRLRGGGRRVELIEEGVGGGLTFALAAPDHLAALVVGDERDVVVLAFPADLIDPNLEQVLQTVGIELVVADAVDDSSDRVPVDPEHPLDRRLVSPRRQPCGQALEIARELRSWAGERNALGARSMLRAPQPPAPAVDLEAPDPEIQMAPHRVLRTRVLARPGRELAQRALQPAALERNLDHHHPGLEPDLAHPHAGQAQKPGKCRRDAHAVPPCKPLTFEQPAACIGGRRRVANQHATSENFFSWGKPCSNPDSTTRPDHIDAGRPANATNRNARGGPTGRSPSRDRRRPLSVGHRTRLYAGGNNPVRLHAAGSSDPSTASGIR